MAEAGGTVQSSKPWSDLRSNGFPESAEPVTGVVRHRSLPGAETIEWIGRVDRCSYADLFRAVADWLEATDATALGVQVHWSESDDTLRLRLTFEDARTGRPS